MPGSEKPNQQFQQYWLDEFEDIEILSNLLELQTRLRKEKKGIDKQLD